MEANFPAEGAVRIRCGEISFRISENAQAPWQRQQQGVLFWQKDRGEAAFYKVKS